MKSFYLKNFKAFSHEVQLDSPSKESVLIYGENGSGKSSLYDAFRLFFFKDRIFNERIPANRVLERDEEETNVISSFAYDTSNDLPDLRLDNVEFADYHSDTAEQIFLISYSDLHPTSEDDDVINIKKLIEKSYLKYDGSLDELFADGMEQYVINGINNRLKEDFYIENLRVSASMTGDGMCALEYENRVTPKKEHLTRYFNEASVHLVRLIALMEFINFVHDVNRPALLVMDDCFNSLDATNRTFVMRYLFKVSKGMQKLIMTHNLSYFNLMSHILNTEHSEEKWKMFILSVVDGKYRFTTCHDESNVNDIIKRREQGYYSDSAQLGNAIRQQFELLVYRLTKLCNVGAMQVSSDLIDQLCKPNQNIYLSIDENRQIKTATHLVDEIYKCLTNGIEYKIVERLKNKIDEYRANDALGPLKPVLKELRLLQKVALHQASHGHEGLPPVLSKEFDVSLLLLKRIEDAIHSVKKDVSTI